MPPAEPDPSFDLPRLGLGWLRQRCAQESARFFRRQEHDPRFCYELFRRALSQGDPAAWEAVFEQYRTLVAGWVERHSLSASLDETAEFFVNRAFEKLFIAIPPERFAAFPDLRSLLRYLQMCVHSAITDAGRARAAAAHIQPEVERPDEDQEQALERLPDPAPTPEAATLQRAGADGLWSELAARLKSEQERCVLYASYVLDLKPAEICEQYPRLFSDPRQVYQVKDNLLARLRRDDGLRALWEAWE
jgi:DNA-directed RNA polymerase specialized sigma24 family protein